MTSYQRSSTYAHGVFNVSVKQLSTKRYTRVLKESPNLCHCYRCKGVMIENPKIIYMNMPTHTDGTGTRKAFAVLVCKACMKFKADIVRAYVVSAPYLGANTRPQTGASNHG